MLKAGQRVSSVAPDGGLEPLSQVMLVTVVWWDRARLSLRLPVTREPQTLLQLASFSRDLG